MNWRLLNSLYKKGRVIKGISLEALSFFGTVEQPLYRVREEVGKFTFEMLRLQISKRKITIHDDLGLIGLSSLDLSKNHCYLTEGVSDFMSTKFMLSTPEEVNVIGVVTLGGNSVAKKILLALFDNYTIISDNDRTGISNLSNFRQFLIANGKNVKMIIPEAGCKDISQQFIRYNSDNL